VDLKINGIIMVDYGITDPETIQPRLQSAVTDKSISVFSHQSHANAEKLAAMLCHLAGNDGTFQHVVFDKLPVDDLNDALTSSDVVVIQTGKSISELTEPLFTLQEAFGGFVDKGGTLIVDYEFGRRLGKHFLANGSGQVLDMRAGMNLWPDCVFQPLDEDTANPLLKLNAALALHPRSVGIRVDRDTMLVLSGRKISCYGTGNASLVLMANDRLPLRIATIVPRSDRRQNPEDTLFDLTEWRRDAIDRTIAPFPPAIPPTPYVKNGSLLIVGGGGLPPGLMNRFVELAGGPDKARLVYIPCSERDEVDERRSLVEQWKAMGVENATMLHTKDRNRSNTDESFMQTLREATGIWFGGGRQWNFSDSWYGTRSHELMKQVLIRGGVIGGSSAGASIQARYLARATPIGNFRIMAPGYERGGLGFIGGVAIDQHFSQRGRQPDMTSLVNRHPQLLGIGIDEATALFVQESRAEILGSGQVFFYDRQIPVHPDQPDYVALPEGSVYDLAKREIIVDKRPDQHGETPGPGDSSAPATPEHGESQSDR